MTHFDTPPHDRDTYSDTPPPSDIPPVGDTPYTDASPSPDVAVIPTPQAHTESDTPEAPYNLDIEASVLGAILRNDSIIQNRLDKLNPEHFYAPEHQTIFKWMRHIADAGQKCSPATMAHLANKTPNIVALGGKAYLDTLASDVLSLINITEYQEILIDLYARRQLILLGQDISSEACNVDLENSAQKQIEKAEQSLYALAEKGDMDKGTIPFTNALEQALKNAEQAFQSDGAVVGVATGLTDMDKHLGGLHPSDLLILAGRPAMGKTALVTNIAFHAAKSYSCETDESGKEHKTGGTVLFFSLEMSAEQLAGRILSEQSEIASDKIRRGDIDKEHFNTLCQVVKDIHNIPLFIDDTPGLTVTAMRQKARRQKRKHGLDLIIVDYLQLLQGSAGKKFDSRVNEVSEITRHLKLIAKDLEVPVIALSQLSRQVENREDKRPQLADLRESGSIEQDADVVMFIYRQEYYLKDAHPERRANESEEKYMERSEIHTQRMNDARNKAEVIIAKQRHGPTGTVELFFNGEFTRFGDLDAHH